MNQIPQWIVGGSRSGKTRQLISAFRNWVEQNQGKRPKSPSALILTANDQNRQQLSDQLAIAVNGRYPVVCQTFLGFISDEVRLFWPILWEKLGLNAQFPLRLRPETEQFLATQLWQPHLTSDAFPLNETSKSQFVRQTLDLLQLAGANTLPSEDISLILEQGLPDLAIASDKFPIYLRGELISEWRNWCLQRGLLSYGITYELYWRYLLTDSKYQGYLSSRYQNIFADDVDNYGGIFEIFAEFMLKKGRYSVFTFNNDGFVRLGLGADPERVSKLAKHCEVIELRESKGLSAELSSIILPLALDPLNLTTLPNEISSIQTSLRSELLRQVGNYIVECVNKQRIKPEEIAIIAPGLDEIARYTLIEILTAGGVPIEPLNEQRPLISCPLVRALLSLLCLVYSGLGRLILRDDIAEMLTILSQVSQLEDETSENTLNPQIDPVRSGLIADYCYHIDPEKPKLLPIETFSRWDRLGYRTTEAYQQIYQWIAQMQMYLTQSSNVTPMMVLDQAIHQLVKPRDTLPYDHLAALRGLMETAQHYWEINRRVRFYDNKEIGLREALTNFILLLRQGTITANARPSRSLVEKKGAVTLATIFQYRTLRSSHRWHFWLDIASPLWEKGGSADLFAAPLFLQKWSGREFSLEEAFEAEQARLKRILKDLLARVEERIILCHSDLSVKGTEQNGALLSLVQGAITVNS
ncbi:MAG: recombinase family protein [Microcystaceae cyanobacterium]